VIDWLGHSNSEMVRYYYHLDDRESQTQMRRLDLLGTSGGRSAGAKPGNVTEKETEPETFDADDKGMIVTSLAQSPEIGQAS